MLQSLTNRNESNSIIAPGVQQRYDDALKKAKGDVSRFAIVFACVLDGNQRPLEDYCSIVKIDAMFGEIELSLRFVPREHRSIVAT